MAEAIGDSHLRSSFGILAPQEQLNATRHVHCRDASGRDCSKERLRSPCCRVSRYDADWTLKYERGRGVVRRVQEKTLLPNISHPGCSDSVDQALFGRSVVGPLLSHDELDAYRAR